MSTQEFITHSAEETIALGRKLAAMLAPPKLVLLRGELGAGKTTLVKGIAEGFMLLPPTTSLAQPSLWCMSIAARESTSITLICIGETGRTTLTHSASMTC